MTDTSTTPDTTLISRTVDLGREDELVTWQEWFARSMLQMKQLVCEDEHERLAFRVTLADGRGFAVRQVTTHVVKGRCSLEDNRWSDTTAICHVITGYLMYGVGEDGVLTTVAVPPTEIASIECVLVPAQDDEDAENAGSGGVPFGFYSRKAMDVPAEQREVEEELKGEGTGH